MKIVCISDTHNKLKNIHVPNGDILIHAGDATSLGREEEIIRFNTCFSQFPHPIKIFVPGNHDFLFQQNEALARSLLSAATHILIDQQVEINGFKFYGSPWTPEFFNWAFMKTRQEIYQVWDKIPENLDILITHGPPFGILDKEQFGEECGCKSLGRYVERLKPRYHVFGHIHESHGELLRDGITYINASILDDCYEIKFRPITIDLD